MIKPRRKTNATKSHGLIENQKGILENKDRLASELMQDDEFSEALKNETIIVPC